MVRARSAPHATARPSGRAGPADRAGARAPGGASALARVMQRVPHLSRRLPARYAAYRRAPDAVRNNRRRAFSAAGRARGRSGTAQREGVSLRMPEAGSNSPGPGIVLHRQN